MINGGFVYSNLFIAQHQNIELAFTNLFNTIKPSKILEIGTLHGGLTLLLRDILDKLYLLDTNITTYDIHDQEFLKPLALNKNINICTKNLFNNSYIDFNNIYTKNEAETHIKKHGVTIVLCDGGCKICEFNLLSPLLKTGDIIMAHDYAPNKEYFEEYMRDKIWNWHEIQDSDIQDSIEKNNLEPYMREEFLNVAWACFRKL